MYSIINIKMRGRPILHQTDEQRKNAIKKSKTKYMLNKPWFCDICQNDKNYTLAGKGSHIKTKLHINNCIIKSTEQIDKFNIITVEDLI